MTRHYRRRRQLLTREQRLARAFEAGRKDPYADNPYANRTSGAALRQEFARGQAAVRAVQHDRLGGVAR